jgi:hypothetical protein
VAGEASYDNVMWADNATKNPKYVATVLNAEDISKVIIVSEILMHSSED